MSDSDLKSVLSFDRIKKNYNLADLTDSSISVLNAMTSPAKANTKILKKVPPRIPIEYSEDLQKNFELINKNLFNESKDEPNIISKKTSQTESNNEFLKNDNYLDSKFFE